MTRKRVLSPKDATNEGTRRLRVILRKHTFGWIARRMRCDERSVRTWAYEDGKPGRVLRARGDEVLAIPENAWDEAPSSDVYAGEEPNTTRRPP